MNEPSNIAEWRDIVRKGIQRMHREADFVLCGQKKAASILIEYAIDEIDPEKEMTPLERNGLVGKVHPVAVAMLREEFNL